MSAASAAANGPWAIDIQDVEKRYKRVRALRGVTLKVANGSVFGLLGPNGAGKSTLVKVMLTIVRATKARGTVLGHPVGSKKPLRNIGFLPEHHRMPPYLTGRQVVRFYGALGDMTKHDRRVRGNALIERVGLAQDADRKIGGYSKGMLQRIGLAQALVTDPDLLFLDEPTDGVDPVGRREIREHLLELKDEGKTIFVNSHILSELEPICDEVAILNRGSLVKQGDIKELTSGSARYELVLSGAAPLAAMPQLPGDAIAEVEAVAGVTPQLRIVVQDPDPATIQPIVDAARGEGREIVSVYPRRESLEELFIRTVESETTS